MKSTWQEAWKAHSRSLLAYTTIATGNDDDLPRLIRNLLCRPGWFRGNELAKDPNTPVGHGSRFVTGDGGGAG